jgi:hypothetical protein
MSNVLEYCARSSAGEHPQASVPNIATSASLARPGQDAAETGRRFARAGYEAIRRQNPFSLGDATGGPCLGCAERGFRADMRHRGPDRGRGRILIPGDGAAWDQGSEQANPPTRGGYATLAASLSSRNGFLPPWSQAPVPR